MTREDSMRLPAPQLSEQLEGMVGGLWYRPAQGVGWRDDVHVLEMMGLGSGEAGLWLTPRGSSRDVVLYPIMRRRGLLTAFERLANQPTPGNILRFVNRWGFLGMPRWVAGDDVKPRLAESWRTWERELGEFAELRTLERIVRVLRYPKDFTPGKVDEASRELAKARYERPGLADLDSPLGKWTWKRGKRGRDRAWDTALAEARRATLAEDTATRDAALQASKEAFVFGPAQYAPAAARKDAPPTRMLLASAAEYLERQINARLRGHVNAELTSAGVRYFPDNLLTAVYLQLAREIAAPSAPERECEYCHQLFPVQRRDPRFCNPTCRGLNGYHERRRGVQAAPDGRV